MDAQQFLAEFGHVANAPDGVARLRELVLALAVTGRLVSQLHTEEPAHEWLHRSDQLKSKLAPRFHKIANAEALRPEDVPFAPPQGWTFVPLNRITTKIGSGSTPRGGSKAYTAEGIPFLRSQNVWNDGIRLDDVAYISEEINRGMSGTVVQPNDLLLNITGASLGRCALVPENFGPANVSQHVTIIRLADASIRKYLHQCFRSPLLQTMIWSRQVGMAREGLSKKVLEQFEIPIPPLAEQARIVAKVDELMALCDRLEKQQQDRRKLQNALRQSTLQALASAESPHELQESWQRLQANFGHLFSEPGDARSLRDVLFDLALRGLLLPDSSLSAAGAPSSEEMGSLPSGWNWKTLAEMTEYITSGSRGWKAYMTSSGDSFIRSQDIREDALIFESPAYVTLPERVEGKRTLVRPGDLLLTITGGNVGRCAVVPALTSKAYVSQHVALIRLQDPSLSEFVHFWMVNAFGGRAFLARYIYGDKPGLNLAQVGSVPIPVPPTSALPEVLKSLRRYQQLCDELETQLRAVQEVASKLSDAAVAALTGATVEKDKEGAVKAPQTELIAPLRLGTLPDVKDQAPLATLLARHHGEMSARDLWQRFGGEIDAFYAQLKTEVAHGWITEPPVAEVRAKPVETAGA